MKDHRSKASRNAARQAQLLMQKGQRDRKANLMMWWMWVGRDKANRERAAKA